MLTCPSVYYKTAKPGSNMWNKGTMWKYVDNMRFWQMFTRNIRFCENICFLRKFPENICFRKSFLKICVKEEKMRAVAWENLPLLQKLFLHKQKEWCDFREKENFGRFSWIFPRKLTFSRRRDFENFVTIQTVSVVIKASLPYSVENSTFSVVHGLISIDFNYEYCRVTAVCLFHISVSRPKLHVARPARSQSTPITFYLCTFLPWRRVNT